MSSPLRWLAGLCASIATLPLVYLVVRAAEAPASAWARLIAPSTWEVIGTTVALAAVVTVGCAVVAVPLAWLTTRTNLPGARWWGVLLSVPLAFPSYLGAYTLVSLFAPGGLLPWGYDPYGFDGAALCLILLSYPYVLLPVRSALASGSRSQEEAAATLGASPWRVFWTVTFPRIRPSLRSGCLLVSLYTVSDFGAVSLLRVNTYTRILYLQFESAMDRSGTAVLALGLALIALTLMFVTQQEAKGGALSDASRVAGRPAALGRWTAPSLVLCAGVFAASTLTPTAVIASWAQRADWSFHEGGVMSPWVGLWGSLSGSVAAAAAATLLALPIATWAAQRGSHAVRGSERVAYLGFGTPGVVVGLALVFLALSWARWSYQTMGLLVFAYALRFLPQATSAQKASLLLISPSLAQAARTLGAGAFSTWRRITLPLSWPGLAAGATLVFLTAMKELPCTLLLAPLDFSTLATQMWSHTSEAAFDLAAAPALLLLAFSVATVAVMLRPVRSVTDA